MRPILVTILPRDIGPARYHGKPTLLNVSSSVTAHVAVEGLLREERSGVNTPLANVATM